MLYVEDNPTSKATLRRSGRSRSHHQASTHTTPRRPPSQRQRNARQQEEDIEADPSLSLQDSGDRDIEDLLQHDATGAPPGSRVGGGGADARGTKRKGIARRSSQRTPRAKGKLKGKGKGKTRAPTLTHEDESDEDLSDSSASLVSDDDDGAAGSGSRSPSSDERSDASIVSVGDFAGYGGAGAGMGGAGMSAAW